MREKKTVFAILYTSIMTNKQLLKRRIKIELNGTIDHENIRYSSIFAMLILNSMTNA